ncbi:MAG: transglutaminase-like domain-containing protein [Planctomycetota bacterium]|jgi:transglutaminase-like putative cysteine protease
MTRFKQISLILIFSILIAPGCIKKVVDKSVGATGSVFRGAGNVVKKTGSIATGVAKKATPSFGSEKQVAEYEFVIDVQGSRRTTGSTKRYLTEYRGEKAVKSSTKQTTTIIREGKTYTREVNRKVFSGSNGEALYSREVTIEGGSRTELIVDIDKGYANFETYGDSGSQKDRVKVPDGVLFSLDGHFLVKQNLAPGKIITAYVLSRRTKQVVRESAEVLRASDMIFKGVKRKTWIVKSVSEATPGNPVTMTFAFDGSLIRMDARGAVFRVVDPDAPESQEEVKPVETYEVVTSVPVDFSVPAWDNFDKIVISPVPAEAWYKHLNDSEYLKVTNTGGDFLITLNSFAPKVPAEASFPIEAENLPKELQPFVKRSGNIIPDEKQIRRLAERITRGEKDALNAVAYLAGWVYDNIKWNTKGRMNTTPLEVLDSKRGDCSEHADLFASLARSVNIPTRHCLGLLIKKKKAVYHNWVEVYLKGVWVPVDTTVNRVGLPSGYILTARDTTGLGDLSDSLPWTMRTSKLGMTVKKLVRGEYTVIPNEKKTYVAFSGNWLANLIWGFALTKPESWDGKIKLKAVELYNSSDKDASFNCEALPTPYKVNKAELDSVAKTMKWRIPGFKKIAAKIVTLRNYDAIFVDFESTANNKTMRCWQYIVPRRNRSYRISCWAESSKFAGYSDDFKEILKSLEF